jgi:hypothetical protein
MHLITYFKNLKGRTTNTRLKNKLHPSCNSFANIMRQVRGHLKVVLMASLVEN